MKKFSDEQKNQISKALAERGANQPCPRCGNKSFKILDGYFVQSIQTDFKGTAIGGLSVPSIIEICKNCGFLSQHALSFLELFPNQENEHEK